MELLAINWWTVLVGVLVSMLVGSLWYNPKTFFMTWWRGIGKSETVQPGSQNMGLVWGLTVLTSVLQVVGMALAVNLVGSALGGVTALTGLLTGGLVWLLIVAPTNLVNKLFAGFPFKVWAIESGAHLVNFLLFGLLLGLWR